MQGRNAAAVPSSGLIIAAPPLEYFRRGTLHLTVLGKPVFHLSWQFADFAGSPYNEA